MFIALVTSYIFKSPSRKNNKCQRNHECVKILTEMKEILHAFVFLLNFYSDRTAVVVKRAGGQKFSASRESLGQFRVWRKSLGHFSVWRESLGQFVPEILKQSEKMTNPAGRVRQCRTTNICTLSLHLNCGSPEMKSMFITSFNTIQSGERVWALNISSR